MKAIAAQNGSTDGAYVNGHARACYEPAGAGADADVAGGTPTAVDELLERHLGGFGPAQWMGMATGGMACFAMGLVIFVQVFTLADPLVPGQPPAWRCTPDTGDNGEAAAACVQLLQRWQAGVGSASAADGREDLRDFCQLQPAQYEWLRQRATATQDFGLVCGRRWQVGNPPWISAELGWPT